MFASVVAVVRCATIGFLQWQFQQLIQIFLFVCVILLTTADAATIVRSFPGNAPWLAYESGSQVNKLLESCIPRPDPGCTTGSNNGLGCKWNVLKSEDLGFGLFGVLRFRNMTSYNFYSPGGTGKWIDRIDNFDLPCLHSRDPSHAEFEFVDSNCRTLPMNNATVHVGIAGQTAIVQLAEGRTWTRISGNADSTSTTIRSGGGSFLVPGSFGALRLAFNGAGDNVRFSVGVNVLRGTPSGTLSPSVTNILDFRRGRFSAFLVMGANHIQDGFEFIRQPDGSVSNVTFTFPPPVGFTPGGDPRCTYINVSTVLCKFNYNRPYMPKSGWTVLVNINNETIRNTLFWEGITNRQIPFGTFRVDWDHTQSGSLSKNTPSFTSTATVTRSTSMSESVSGTLTLTPTGTASLTVERSASLSRDSTKSNSETLSLSDPLSRTASHKASNTHSLPSSPTATADTSESATLIATATASTSHTATPRILCTLVTLQGTASQLEEPPNLCALEPTSTTLIRIFAADGGALSESMETSYPTASYRRLIENATYWVTSRGAPGTIIYPVSSYTVGAAPTGALAPLRASASTAAICGNGRSREVARRTGHIEHHPFARYPNPPILQLLRWLYW